MDKNLFKALRSQGLINKIKCPSGKHFTECECGNQMLRSWMSKNGLVALCYECGNLFYLFDQNVIKKFTGNPEMWADQVYSIVENINEYKEPYHNHDLDGRKNEFIEFITNEIRRHTEVPDEISNEELFENFTTCSQCDKQFFTDTELNHALLEYESPERTMDILNEVYTNHMIFEIEKQEYENVINPPDVWESDKYEHLFIDSDIRNIIVKAVSEQFCKWVIEGILFDVVHDYDPSWDCSGKIEPLFSNKAERLVMYSTLGEWMESCYNGDTAPTFESGKGLAHLVFESQIEDLISDILRDFWYEDLSGEELDELFEDDSYFDEENSLEMKIMEFVHQIPALQAWYLAKDDTQKWIDDREKKAIEYHEQREEKIRLVNKFWFDNFKDINRKIIKSNSKEFIKKFDELISNCGKEVLVAIKEFSLPCAMSSNVRDIVNKKINVVLEKKN